jgi:hypothetical protein
MADTILATDRRRGSAIERRLVRAPVISRTTLSTTPGRPIEDLGWLIGLAFRACQRGAYDAQRKPRQKTKCELYQEKAK